MSLSSSRKMGRLFCRSVVGVFLCMSLVSSLTAGAERLHVVLSNDVNFVFLENDGKGKFTSTFSRNTAIDQPHEITAGDFDRDGIWDAAVNHWQADQFTVFWGGKEGGKRTFVEETFAVGRSGQMHAIGAGDFDEDGNIDLALVDNENALPKSIVVAFGQGGRSFGRFQRYDMPRNGNARSIKVDDFNGDGHLDFISSDANQPIYYLFWGDGTGNFEVNEKETTDAQSFFMIDSGDIDQDGDKDLVVANGNLVTLFKLEGKDFIFSESFRSGTAQVKSARLGDFNGDGFIDVVAVKEDGMYTWVWKQDEAKFKAVTCLVQGRPTLCSPFSFSNVFDMALADFDADGILDTAVALFNGGQGNVFTGIAFFKGQGDGQFICPDLVGERCRNIYSAGIIAGGGVAQAMIDLYREEVPDPVAPLFLRGDVNHDGNLDLSDAISILNGLFLGKGQPTCWDAADVNDDGNVDLSDPIYLLNRLFSGGALIPGPAESAGPDPTMDGLSCG